MATFLAGLWQLFLRQGVAFALLAFVWWRSEEKIERLETKVDECTEARLQKAGDERLEILQALDELTKAINGIDRPQTFIPQKKRT